MTANAKEKRTPRAIFLAVRQAATPNEQSQLLDEMCAGQHELRQQVEEMLIAAQSAQTNPLDRLGAMLNATKDWQSDSMPDLEKHPLIGRYKLMEQIGEGGMGVVFVAEQVEPVRRRVALKIIKPGMDSKQVIARFESERQALAIMDHPNISRVLDAGTTTQGLPYFVMELVRGLPITEYCDQAKLSTDERLALFIAVCGAVQHAHQKGIIHRDIKPNNVLVTLHDGTPVVKVIDFGVAKAINQQLSSHTIYTGLNQLIGTPLYMSPEQLEHSGLDIDTRTDVYSLGVLLYEMITGTTPFDRERLLKSGFDEMRRIIREEEPPRPSYRLTTVPKAELSTVAEKRGLDQRELKKSIQSELDWITLKALAKDRTRRYGSAAEFATDIQRFLDDAPVLACPPSVWYLTGKVLRKHRGLLTSAGILFATLVVGTIVSINQAIRATKAEYEVEKRLGQVTVEQHRTRDALIAVEAAEAEQRQMRVLAESEAIKAQQAAVTEKELRGKAESAIRESQWNLYVANLATMQSALKDRNYGRLATMLESSVPAAGESDFRGWEWYYLQQRVEASFKSLPRADKDNSSQVIDFNPSGHELAVYTAPSFIDIWDARSLTKLRRFDCQASISSISWSPNGDHIALGTFNTNELIVIDSHDGRLVWRIHPLEIRTDKLKWVSNGGLAWHSDSERIAVGSRFGDIAIVNFKARTTELLHSVKDEGFLGDLEWHPHDHRLLAGMRFGKRLIFNTVDRTSKPLTPHGLEIGYATAWSPSGKLLATSEGPDIRIANDLGEDAAILRGHVSVVTDLEWVDDRYLVSSSKDKSVRLWDIEKSSLKQSWQLFDDPVNSVAVSPSGDRLAIASNVEVKVVDLEAAESELYGQIPNEVGQLLADDGVKNGLTDLRWSRDGTEIFTIGEVSHSTWVNCVSALFNPVSMRRLNFAETRLCKGAAWDPDSRFILRASVGDQLKVDDPRTGICLQTIPCQLFGEPIAKWSPSRKWVMTYNDRRPPLLKDGSTGDMIHEWPADVQNGMFEGAWDPAETKFIAGGHGQAALLRVDGTSAEFLDQNSSSSFSIAWHPSGRIAALGNTSGDIWIRDGETLAIVARLRGHIADVKGLDFSPDGRRLASSSQDGTVRIWDVATGRELIQLTTSDFHRFSRVSWSPDGQQLAVGTFDRDVFLFGRSNASAAPTDSAVPQHGTIFQFFHQQNWDDEFKRNVSRLPWREPLHQLMHQIDGLATPCPPDLTAVIRRWIAPSLGSAERFESYLTAARCLIDGSLDECVAHQFGKDCVQVLNENREILGARKTLEWEIELRYVLCHRLSTSSNKLETVEAFHAASQAIKRFTNEFEASSADWKRRIAFETLRPYTAMNEYLDGLKRLAPDTTGDVLRQVLFDYRNFMQKVPLDALPFKVPTNTQQVFNEWIVNITQQEIRMGVVPTFKKEWLDSFTQDIANQVQGYSPYYHMAVTQLVTEDESGYAETCRRMLDRFLETNKPLEARFAAWTACLAPSSLSDYSPALDFYQRLHSGDAVGVELGALLYRAGEFSRARDELLRIAEIENPNSSPAYVWYFLAMVEMKLGNRDTATAWAKKADERLAEQQSAAAYSTTLWNRVATERLLQRETQMVLQGTNE